MYDPRSRGKYRTVISSLLSVETHKNIYNYAEEVAWIDFSSAAVQCLNFNIEQTYHQGYFFLQIICITLDISPHLYVSNCLSLDLDG